METQYMFDFKYMTETKTFNDDTIIVSKLRRRPLLKEKEQHRDK